MSYIKFVIEALALWIQLEDTGLLIGTLLLFDPVVLFPICEALLLFGSILNFEALLGAPLIKLT